MYLGLAGGWRLTRAARCTTTFAAGEALGLGDRNEITKVPARQFAVSYAESIALKPTKYRPEMLPGASSCIRCHERLRERGAMPSQHGHIREQNCLR